MTTAPHPDYPPSLGARYLGEGKCHFQVWAPKAESVELHVVAPTDRLVKMNRDDRGYFKLLQDAEPGTRYFYRLDGQHDRPDPASRFQPEGVHHASEVVAADFPWQDDHWSGLPLHQYITYELHVGTFTPEGTFDAAIGHLDELVDLGVTAVELMPVSQFSGGRNWGYDGVHPFAPQNTYGGPEGLKRLVNAAHARGLAVIMDVVYNHLGPEGNYLAEFGHYFTDRHHTPWGDAVNFDGPHSDEVRRYFIENALFWIDECHIDALRLDAVHAIYDSTARPFLQELADAVWWEGERLGRRTYTIAESSLNDPRVCLPKNVGGLGLDAEWCEDLHHALRTTLTDERYGYYADFRGFDDLLKAYREGYVLDGRYSQYRSRRHGRSARAQSPTKIVVCSQNHDQVGNRLAGERLSVLVSLEELKLAAAVVLLSPYLPLLFMGEEYGETAPFQFFTSHLDADLVEAVRWGRKADFAPFRWQGEPPDPQDEATFKRSKLNHALKREDRHRTLRAYYKELIRLRKTDPALAMPARDRVEAQQLIPGQVMGVRRWSRDRELFMTFSFAAEPVAVEAPLTAGRWAKLLDSADARWRGPGSRLPDEQVLSGGLHLVLAPHSAVVYGR